MGASNALCRWQFENHGNDHEKTKLKLLEAANLVDKVLPIIARR